MITYGIACDPAAVGCSELLPELVAGAILDANAAVLSSAKNLPSGRAVSDADNAGIADGWKAGPGGLRLARDYGLKDGGEVVDIILLIIHARGDIEFGSPAVGPGGQLDVGGLAELGLIRVDADPRRRSSTLVTFKHSIT